ncbi:MAG: hypothetical protein APR55_05715 [Methanolinea sp. SDB]|nr:MAG: hypothetical protein APR55_05715 [Methanolinea sp. SDB]
MAVNQAQVDHIISTASADDPEVKLLKLQDEVELIKTSIKKLLIDIRERMNDLENPIVVGQSGGGYGQDEASTRMASMLRDTSSAVESAAGALKASSDSKKSDDSEKVKAESPAVSTGPAETTAAQAQPQVQAQAAREDLSGQLDLLSAFKAQLAAMPEKEAIREISSDKVRLQKVFRLFEWTSKNVNKFGHDRVDLMLEAYHAMGYITDSSCKLVKDMARLMPENIGDMHEIQANEFVSELYELNHILDPSDSTLDRDMIEVLMEKRQDRESRKLLSSSRAEEEESEREYIRSPDRT